MLGIGENMKKYKVITLGAEFFLSGASDETGAGRVTLLPDKDKDIEYAVFASESTFVPDLYRALSAYLFSAVGLPASDYSILHGGRVITVSVPKRSDMRFGGLIGENLPLGTVENGLGLNLHDVMTPLGVCRVALLEHTGIADFAGLGSRLMRLPTERTPSFASALSGGNGEYALLVFSTSGARYNSCAIGAAARLAAELGDVSEEYRLTLGDHSAVCTVTPRGVSVFDTSPCVLCVL